MTGPHYDGLAENDVTDEQTVVVHVCHGDIYPSNFSSKHVLPEYGQPPLSFYLSVFDFVKPKRVIMVGELSFKGPVWKALQMLQKHKALRYNVEFRSGQFREDLRLMLCAKTFVESRSTLMSVVPLGFARRVFTSEECYRPDASAPLRKVYTCESSNDYKKYYKFHANSAPEWGMRCCRAPKSLALALRDSFFFFLTMFFLSFTAFETCEAIGSGIIAQRVHH